MAKERSIAAEREFGADRTDFETAYEIITGHAEGGRPFAVVPLCGEKLSADETNEKAREVCGEINKIYFGCNKIYGAASKNRYITVEYAILIYGRPEEDQAVRDYAVSTGAHCGQKKILFIDRKGKIVEITCDRDCGFDEERIISETFDPQTVEEYIKKAGSAEYTLKGLSENINPKLGTPIFINGMLKEKYRRMLKEHGSDFHKALEEERAWVKEEQRKKEEHLSEEEQEIRETLDKYNEELEEWRAKEPKKPKVTKDSKDKKINSFLSDFFRWLPSSSDVVIITAYSPQLTEGEINTNFRAMQEYLNLARFDYKIIYGESDGSPRTLIIAHALRRGEELKNLAKALGAKYRSESVLFVHEYDVRIITTVEDVGGKTFGDEEKIGVWGRGLDGETLDKYLERLFGSFKMRKASNFITPKNDSAAKSLQSDKFRALLKSHGIKCISLYEIAPAKPAASISQEALQKTAAEREELYMGSLKKRIRGKN
ncbi:MAG: hypothetical protein HUJ86_04595 [Synergistes sp.]|nr:hypothetical protein [Synergistes sp.]